MTITTTAIHIHHGVLGPFTLPLRTLVFDSARDALPALALA